MINIKIKYAVICLLVSNIVSLYSTLETCNLELDKLAIVGKKLRHLYNIAQGREAIKGGCANACREVQFNDKINTIDPAIAKIIRKGCKQCINQEAETDIDIPTPKGIGLHRYDRQFSWQIGGDPYKNKQMQQWGTPGNDAFNAAKANWANPDHYWWNDLGQAERECCENYGGIWKIDWLSRRSTGVCKDILPKEPCSTPLPDNWKNITEASIPDDWPNAKPKIVEFLANFNPASSDQEIVNYVDQYKEAIGITDSFIATSNRLVQLNACKTSGNLPKNNTDDPSKDPMCCYGEPKADGTCKTKAEYCKEIPGSDICF